MKTDPTVFVLARDHAALFTLASLEVVMPGVAKGVVLEGSPQGSLGRYLKEHSQLLVCESKMEHEALYLTLREQTQGLAFCISEGALVLKDLRKGFVALKQPQTFGCSRQHMYAGMMGRDAAYRTLQINPHEHTGEGLSHFWLDRPWDPIPCRYPNGTVWSHDPLVDVFMSGTGRVKHAWKGTQAYVLDYFDFASNADLSVEHCSSAPLEYYVPYAEKLRPYLPEESYEAIVRNGKRSGFFAPLRRLMAPSHIYYAQMLANPSSLPPFLDTLPSQGT